MRVQILDLSFVDSTILISNNSFKRLAMINSSLEFLNFSLFIYNFPFSVFLSVIKFSKILDLIVFINTFPVKNIIYEMTFIFHAFIIEKFTLAVTFIITKLPFISFISIFLNSVPVSHIVSVFPFKRVFIFDIIFPLTVKQIIDKLTIVGVSIDKADFSLSLFVIILEHTIKFMVKFDINYAMTVFQIIGIGSFIDEISAFEFTYTMFTIQIKVPYI